MPFRAGPRSLAATKGISVDFFSYGYLDVSVHRVRLINLCIQLMIPINWWVSPFRNPRVLTLVCKLPEAYRMLQRLSSPLTAKAFTMCA